MRQATGTLITKRYRLGGLGLSALAARIMVCLFCAQIFALGAVPQLLHGSNDSGDASIAESAYRQNCSVDGGPFHSQDRHQHRTCCILCAASGRDVALLAVIAFVSLFEFPAESAVLFWRIVKADMGDGPVGFASSWSSRAPPRSY